jgi:integrase
MTVIAVHTLRSKTIESYEDLIRLNIKPELGNVKVTALRPDHLQNQYSLKLNQGLVFITSHGTSISPRNLIRHFKQALEEAGLLEIRFHDLRHTHASLLLAAGFHPKPVQERFGHSQISLTLDTYSYVIPNPQKEAAEKMNGLFK